MAKVSKELLKEIVKECLVEILAEGLTGGDVKSLKENVDNVSYKPNRNIQSMLPPKKRKKVSNKSFEDNTRKAINAATSDPVMAALLEDTAKTTLQEQNSADSPGKFAGKATDSASKIVSEADPSELFGEAASNWSHLAFTGQK
tara:strand:- start:41 stop:472 length:432 start_codon:yes stop_codon:yes gene_type:complete